MHCQHHGGLPGAVLLILDSEVWGTTGSTVVARDSSGQYALLGSLLGPGRLLPELWLLGSAPHTHVTQIISTQGPWGPRAAIHRG